MCKIDTEPDNSLKNLFEFEGNGLNFKLKHRKVYIQFHLWDSVTGSGDWEICAVPGLENRGELAHMLSHNRLIIIYDVGICLYHMMKLAHYSIIQTLMAVSFLSDGAVTK